MTLHERLRTLIGDERVTPFEERMGFSRGSLAKALDEGRAIGSDRLEAMLAAHPHWNPTWLMTGAGDMYLTPDGVALDSLQFRVRKIEKTLSSMQKADEEQEARLKKGCPAYQTA
jgi:hypothetical protein